MDREILPGAMSQLQPTHAELIRRSYRAFREDDLEALLGLYHPEAVWDMTHWQDFPEASVYTGLSGTKDVLRLLRDAFGEFDVQPVEIVEAGEERVLVVGRMTVRGKASGAEVQAPPFAQVIEFRDNLIARVDAYSDAEAGRRAAGLTSG
jgi:ketosteroid isomerase-like protein